MNGEELDFKNNMYFRVTLKKDLEVPDSNGDKMSPDAIKLPSSIDLPVLDENGKKIGRVVDTTYDAKEHLVEAVLCIEKPISPKLLQSLNSLHFSCSMGNNSFDLKFPEENPNMSDPSKEAQGNPWERQHYGF